MSSWNDENVGWIFVSLCPGEQTNARTGSWYRRQLPQAFLRHAVHVLQSKQRLSRILSQRLLLLAVDSPANDASDEPRPGRRHSGLCVSMLRLRSPQFGHGRPFSIHGHPGMSQRLVQHLDRVLFPIPYGSRSSRSRTKTRLGRFMSGGLPLVSLHRMPWKGNL